MTDHVCLHGYRYSVYNRIARLTLLRKRVSHDLVEVDPFSELPVDYMELHPFGRVPVLIHNGFAIYETAAMTRYIDRAFPGDALQPEDPKILARMDQVISVIDNYCYWPMVRQVFSHRIFRPITGEPACRNEIMQGMKSSGLALAALERIALEGHVLNGKSMTLADLHLAPMIDYFTRAEEGQEALSDFPGLSNWWKEISLIPELSESDPDLSALLSG
ncbi:glutathione S-transferase family protein [Paracoccus onubensis]|uniref:Glutathione S-transferase family protein n=1 Tax=Paracoccus onubensis TaxID=1675788 RepID=A0A418T0D0_9RHOB|nr:glutathione S-transferase family protein [Paracoccus onubensis]RJE86633.1 glutathione S-transferase family protein [Paracoccus onubensis]